MTIKLFNMDLHISVIKDFQNIAEKLFGKNIEITNWSISCHNWVFNQPTAKVKIINQNTWTNIDDYMIQKFNIEYEQVLSEYDGFIVTHAPVFALIYEQYNKPIIVINSCRFDQPFCWNNNIKGFEWLVEGLHRLKNKGLLHIFSNNKADQEYLLRGSGLESDYIPSLCDYTEAPYNPIKSQFVLYNPSSLIHTCKDPKNSPIAPKPSFGYTWKELHSYKAIVHMPYEISTMSIFEQYTAGIPMLFPSKQFYKECCKNGSINNQSIYGNLVKTDLDFWLEHADFYNNDVFKNIIFFNSFDEILDIYNNFKYPGIEVIEKTLSEHKNNILWKWYIFLEKLFKLNPKSISWKYTSDFIQSDKLYRKFSNDYRIRYIKTDALIKPNIAWYSNQQFETDKRLVMITSHSDLGIDKQLFEANCNRAVYWITTNKCYSYNDRPKKLFGLPLGLTNFIDGSPLHEIYSDTEQIEFVRKEVQAKEGNEVKKNILCYMNFSEYTNLSLRVPIWQKFSKKDFVICELPENSKTARLNYLRKLAKSKFTICPAGFGIDTHRLWEALYVGCIPVVHTNPVHDDWQDLPILFIKSWDDITEDFLNKKWIEMAWQNYNFNKLTNTYWERFIEKLSLEAEPYNSMHILHINCRDLITNKIDTKKILAGLSLDKELIIEFVGFIESDLKIAFHARKFAAYFEEWNPKIVYH